jgi:hypothetical protein
MSMDILRLEDRLRLLGFRAVPNSPGALDTTIAGVHVTVTSGGDQVQFLAEHYARGHCSFHEHWAPIGISVQDIANRLWRFAVKARPELVPREVRWIQDKLKGLQNSRPGVCVSRSAFRSTVRALQRELGEDCASDLVIRFQPVMGEHGYGLLSFCEEQGSLSLAGRGVWVGAVRVKAADLFFVLRCRFRQDPLWAAVRKDGIHFGHVVVDGHWEDDCDTK